MTDVRPYPDPESLSRAAAELFCTTARHSATEDRPAFIAVSGGSTPRRMFELLAEPPFRDEVPWAWLQLCWVDERPVPPDHPDSNYRMVKESLLGKIPLPATSIHRIPTERGTPDQVADLYQLELQAILPRMGNGFPRFDLVLLGMGDDGHTASLFPHSPGLREQKRWVLANPVEKLGHARITLTYPAINHAANVAFLVSGAEKAATLRRVLSGPRNIDELPAQGVAPTSGRLLWLADEAAANG